MIAKIREPLTTEIFGKEFYLAHGDGLGDPDKKFKMLRAMFRSRTLQTLFSALQRYCVHEELFLKPRPPKGSPFGRAGA